ncbi:esterase/lipase family protein [Frigoriglobus tundricola]|uniref:AB hydrolase-1 domain-containing protein n=1 Tax=Frigoriglobus tundricola TaxID=2774151 RepID=A0A6M5YKY7_9BACT|nr:alpha/beta fold hydrolase [Frigoriglobus tundricola]QJW93931.1 hypothetical protein FTUN_1445 [Frigoriglobus tundricola]
MILSLTTVMVACVAPCDEVATEMWQVAPGTSEKPWVVPAQPSEKTAAVVLIHGLYVHPIAPAKAKQPWLRWWQKPKTEIVTALAKDFDVFSFAYSQTLPVEEVARSAGLRDAVANLRKAGYKDVILVGHSAGGVVSRLFVEQFPDAGVTKVIAVAAPFAGVKIATVKVGYPKVQAPFVESLAPGARVEATRANKTPLGRDVQFVSVVCKLKHADTDGLVRTHSQWPEDLQQLGVPAVLVDTNHFTAMEHPTAVKRISELAREKLTRWGPDETEKARKELFGEPKPMK